jgi:hypothetical protein
MTKQYVAIIQQGIGLGQRIVSVGDDRDVLQARADEAAEKLNDAAGFDEAYSAVVLEAP